MHIGLDFDNTLAGYDRVFRDAARDAGFVEAALAPTKKEVRDLVRLSSEGDVAWQRLQAEVYALRMPEAELIDGVAEFLLGCRSRGWSVAIVSHKTETAPYDPLGINLRQAALDWMAAQGFFSPAGFGLDRADVHFRSTRAEKVAKIAQLGCAAFVDDLEEVFVEPGFPPATARYLYHPAVSPPAGDFLVFSDWRSLGHDLFQRFG